MRAAVLFYCVIALTACADRRAGREITISASAVGAEGEILQRQIGRFQAAHPGVKVRIQRTPDDATQRHQLYVQWLNARIGTPDVLQLDVVWTAEFAAAGWIAPLGDRFDERDFFPATIDASRWRGRIYAVPWFVDVGMLYRRTDIVPLQPATLDEIRRAAAARPASIAAGFVWQGARYEGLVTSFLEILSAHGGQILDSDGRPVLDSPAAHAALTWMQSVLAEGTSPPAVLTWHEEEVRFAFQNGSALFMRNWPYAVPLLADAGESAVASRFAISPIPPSVPGGNAAATLGGAPLAINRWSGHVDLAWELISFLTAPEQMLERAEATGQFPPRRSLFGTDALDRALGTDSRAIGEIVASAVARPATPLYSEISEALQIELHRALSGGLRADLALRRANAQIEAILARSELLVQEGR